MLENGKNGSEATSLARKKIAQSFREVKTSHDLLRALNEVMASIAEGSIDPQQVQEICRIANVSLRMLELQLKHGHLEGCSNGEIGVTKAEYCDITKPKALTNGHRSVSGKP